MTDFKLDKKDILYFQNKIILAGKKFYTSFEWRNTKNKFHALTAEILLQRTNADQVLPVYIDFIKKYNASQQFIDSPKNIFLTLGLNWRYERFLKLCEQLNTLKEIPDSKIELLKLPCVGEYVASAFLSLHLNKREYIIDSNIVRLYGRFFGFNTDGETIRKKWFADLSDSLTPLRKFRDYNYGLLDVTRLICNRNPLCYKCVLNKKCKFFLSKTAQDVRF